MKNHILLLALMTSSVLGTIEDLIPTTTQKRSLGYLLYNTTSTTPLAAGEEYNSGPIDIAEFSMISLVITGTPATAKGDLYLEFSPDSMNWDHSIHIPVENLETEPPHTFLPVSVFFRIRYVNGSVDQNSMRLQAVFHRSAAKGLTSRLEGTLNSSADVDNVRAVIVGKNPKNIYENTRQDGPAFRTTTNLGGTTLSGELTLGTTGTQTIFTDLSGFATRGYIYIDSELIGYSTNNLTDTLTITERGAFGTTDATHSLGATVGEAYTSGLLKLDGYTEVATKMLCSNTGRMRFQWYSDALGTHNIRTITPPYATTHLYDFLAAPNFGPYVRYTFANTQPFNTTNLYFETEFYTKSISAQVLTLNSSIVDGMTTNLTRSIMAGKNPAGNYQNVQINAENALEVDVKGSTTAFGEIGTSEATAISQIQFTYGFNPALMTNYLHNGGTMTQDNNMLVLSTGTNQQSLAKVESNLPIRYGSGQGAFCRFSAKFTSGVTGSSQYAGVGDQSNGFFFGYKDNIFGITRRTGGSPEVRTLTLTEKAEQDQDINIVLDGVIKTISVRGTDDITDTANEIANADYSQTGSGWTAKTSGSSITFIAWDASQRNGTYALTATENPVNKRPEGSFTQTIAGKAPQEYFTPQNEWNIDPYNGTGVGGITLDPTKGNIYQIRWQWLGFGAISFFVENPATGSLERVHTERYPNNNEKPSVEDPNLRLHLSTKNSTNTSNIRLSSASIAGFIDGKDTPFGVRAGVQGIKSVRQKEIPLITLRNSLIYNGKINNTRGRINFLFLGSNHSQPIQINLYANATLKGASFVPANPISSMEYDNSATELSGGIYVGSTYIPPKGTQTITLSFDPTAALMPPGGSFSLTAKSIGSNKAGNVYGVFNFLEVK